MALIFSLLFLHTHTHTHTHTGGTTSWENTKAQEYPLTEVGEEVDLVPLSVFPALC